MFCQQCGTQIEDGLAFCTNCGAKQIAATTKSENSEVQQDVMYGQYMQSDDRSDYSSNRQAYAQPDTYTYPNTGALVSPKRVGFIEAVKLFFINYVNFSGRSTISEYWWVVLFNFLVSLCTSWIPVVGKLIPLGLFIPGLALSVRRLHDTGKHWYYIFMVLIPLVGFVILIVRYCMVSDADNIWGPAPKN